MEAVAEVIVNVKNVPALRFTEFEGDWESAKLNNLIYDLQSGVSVNSEDVTIDSDEEYGILKTSCVSSGMFFENEHKRIIKNDLPRAKLNPLQGTILISRMNTPKLVGESGYVDKDFPNLFIPDRLWLASVVENKVNTKWLSYFLITDKTRYILSGIATGTSESMKNISQPNFLNVKASVPKKLAEQIKIASFLSAVDYKIQQLSRKKDLLGQYKKGVMQQIFSRQIRFKDDNGNDFPEWEEKKLGQVFDRVKTKNAEDNKNVLTISAQHGLINQEDFFNKSVSAENVTGYYLLHKGDFAYNKSYSKGYPMGAIKRLTKYDKGVVSTLYICFKIIDGSSEEYFEQYFNSGYLNRELHKIAQEGARNHGLLNMSVVEFFNDVIVPRPTKAEQIKIVNFLISFDKKLALATKQLEQARLFKKGLLQQMFV